MADTLEYSNVAFPRARFEDDLIEELREHCGSGLEISDRDGVKYILTDNSWLLIRPSGTEPVLRIYAEARTDAQVKALLKEGAALAEIQIAMLAAVS